MVRNAVRWLRVRGSVPRGSRGIADLGTRVQIKKLPKEKADNHTHIRDSVRALCEKFPGEYWREKDRQRAYPTEFVQELTNSGFLSLLIPEEYGGSGLTLRDACVVMEEIHRSGCNGGAAHAQMYTMGTILRYGSDAQKQQYLPKIASGELRLQAFGVSEPNSGTDTLSLETTASRDGDEYIINGTKLWTSRAEHSDLMLLLAKTAKPGDGTPRKNWLSTFLIDMRVAQESGGMTIRPVETMINHNTTQVFFDNLRIPASAVIGEVGQGFKYILGSMNAERILIASESIGDARFFIDKATAYANERKVFQRPIGQNQGISFPLAQAYAQTESAALMMQAATALYEANEDCGAQANMAKYLAAEAAWAAGDACMVTHGGFAFATEYDIERKWRESKLYRIAPISANLILSHLAEKVLGLPRSF